MATVKLPDKPAAPEVETAVVVYNGKLYNADIATLRRALECLPLGGGTLTGPLILAGAPGNDLEAATKKYVDGLVRDTVTGNIHVYDIGSAAFDPSTLDFSLYRPGDVILVVQDMEASTTEMDGA